MKIATSILACATVAGAELLLMRVGTQNAHFGVVFSVLASWVMMSFPAGILAGHCVLGED